MPRLTQRERRETTRRKLLESAAQVFADRGFNGASIEQIAESASLSRGAFYAHFEDKEELFLAVLEDMVDGLQHFSAEPREGGGPAALLDAVTGVHLGHSRVDPVWFRLYSEFRAHALRDARRERLAEHYSRLRDVVAQVVEAQFAAIDVTPPMTTNELASLVIALDEGLAIQRGVEPDAIRQDLVVDMLRILVEAATALDRQRHVPPRTAGER